MLREGVKTCVIAERGTNAHSSNCVKRKFDHKNKNWGTGKKEEKQQRRQKEERIIHKIFLKLQKKQIDEKI